MNFAIILASGDGKRMHVDTPKQFLLVEEKPLIYFSLKVFEDNDNIDEIVVVTKKKYFSYVYECIEKFDFQKVHLLVSGGKTRQQSVANAIESLKGFAMSKDIIVIHDCARPLVSQRIINDCIEATKKHNASTTAINCVDTIARRKLNKFEETLNRSELVNIQTPQAFTYGYIKKAHKIAKAQNIINASDDSQLIKNILNKNVYLVPGDKYNLKVTTIDDLELIKAIIKRRHENGTI